MEEYKSITSVSKENGFVFEEMLTPCSICSVEKKPKTMGSRMLFPLPKGFMHLSMCPEHWKEWQASTQRIRDLIMPHYQVK